MMTVDVGFLALSKMLLPIPQDEKARLLSYLSENNQARLKDQPKISNRTLKSFSITQLFKKIHPSWYEEVLNRYSVNDREYYLSAIDANSYSLSEELREYALKTLFDKSFSSRPTPLEFLPDDPFLVLSLAPYNSLKKLCIYLGLFDLAYELKKVISASTLREIEASFTHDELAFMKKAKTLHAAIRFPEIGLIHFDGNKEVLRGIVFQRGLNRLAKALSRSYDGLIWYIVHTLSKNEGKQLKKLLQPVNDPLVQKAFIDQAIFAWEAIGV